MLHPTTMFSKIYKVFIVPYTLFLLYLMFFGFGRKQYEFNVIRLIPLFSTFNFVKQNILMGNFRSLIPNVFGNIIMFMPFGFLGLISSKYQDFKTLLFDFLVAIIAVEALQYFTRLGIFDIDDILLNSLGVWFGFLIFTKRLFKLTTLR